MIIREVELREIHLKLRERFEISTGGWDERRILLLRMECDEGEAWSECVAAEAPNYSYETPETAWHILTDHVFPHILGREYSTPGSILEPVSWIRGHPMALAAVEMGAWGLAAVRESVSLSALMGGARAAVPVGVSVGIQGSDEELLGKVEERIGQGYQVIIFPEGTRRPPLAEPNYKYGVTYLYDKLNAPCLPIALNSGLFWPRRTFAHRQGVVTLNILPPIPPGHDADTFSAELQEAIESAVAGMNAEAMRRYPVVAAAVDREQAAGLSIS